MVDIYLRICSASDDIIAIGLVFSYAPARRGAGPPAITLWIDADQRGVGMGWVKAVC